MVERLVSSILDGAMGGENWDIALDEICKETGAKGGVLQADDEEHVRSHLLGTSRFFREDGAFIIDRYRRGNTRFRYFNPRFRFPRRNSPSRPGGMLRRAA